LAGHVRLGAAPRRGQPRGRLPRADSGTLAQPGSGGPMSALLLVEFRRLLARRIVRFVGAMALLGLLIAGLVLFVRSHRLDAPSTARLRTKVETAYQDRKSTRLNSS